MAKQSKSEKQIEKRIDVAYRSSCNGIQINMMDISKVFAVGRARVAAGDDDAALALAIRAFVETIRQN